MRNCLAILGPMSNVTKIHERKQGHRPHFIPQWAAKYGMSQADISRETEADKSSVSRWFDGATPFTKHQESLAALFQIERQALFRHPDEDWFVEFFADRKAEEVERMKDTLKAAFPKRA